MFLCASYFCVFSLSICSLCRCKVCPLTFFSKSDMQIHSKTHTEAKAHKCAHCTKSFANASYLAQHLRIHLGVKPYRCTYCEKSFRQLSHLQQHTRFDVYIYSLLCVCKWIVFMYKSAFIQRPYLSTYPYGAIWRSLSNMSLIPQQKLVIHYLYMQNTLFSHIKAFIKITQSISSCGLWLHNLVLKIKKCTFCRSELKSLTTLNTMSLVSVPCFK